MNSSNPKFKTFASRMSMDYERLYTDGPLDPPSVIGLSELRQLVADDNYGDLPHHEVIVEYFGIEDDGKMVEVFPVFWEDTTDSACLTHTVSLGPSDRLAGFSTNREDRWLSATDDNLAVSLGTVERWEKENHWVADDDAEERYDASQLARAIQEPLADGRDYEQEALDQAERFNDFDDIPF